MRKVGGARESRFLALLVVRLRLTRPSNIQFSRIRTVSNLAQRFFLPAINRFAAGMGVLALADIVAFMDRDVIQALKQWRKLGEMFAEFSQERN